MLWLFGAPATPASWPSIDASTTTHRYGAPGRVSADQSAAHLVPGSGRGLRVTRGRQRFQLNRSHYGLYIPPMVWRELENFSSGSVAMVLASDFYDEADYLREHAEFTRAVVDL